MVFPLKMNNIDVPYEPADWEPIDWDAFNSMKQDIRSYFVKVDEFGKSEMDYWVEQKMDFGKDEELPIAPELPVKAAKPVKKAPANATKKWAPTKPISRVKATNTAEKARGPVRSMRTLKKPEKFVREDMRDEVLALEMEELALCKEDDYGTAFDLEL
jgi:hypothetical protein